MNKKNKKLIFGSLLGVLSILAICACVIVNTNMPKQTNEDNDSNLPAATEPVAQSNNVEAASAVDAYQSPNARYVDTIYSQEVNQSMQRIQASYAESIKKSNDGVTDVTNNQFREGSVGSSASKLANNFLAGNNNVNSDIKWSVTLNKDKKFDTFTLHISTDGNYDIDSDDSPAWRNGFEATGLDGKEHKYSFFDITKVSIDKPIQPTSCKAWFGCANSNPGQARVRLSNIESISKLDNLDMSDVSDVSFMFMGCDLLTLSSLPVMSNATNIEAVFALTKSFTNEIYKSAANSFTTINNGKDAFINNATLTDIDVSNWNVDACTDMSYIFCNCPSLATINSKADTDWSQKSFTDTGMFKGCTSLKGGKDTLYSDKFTGKDYAKADAGQSSPGYFTALEPPATWIPMQAKANALVNPIDFYPAFNQGDKTVANYKFAVKKDNTYTQVQASSGDITMSDIYNALKDPQISDSYTLYYEKTSSNAPTLKCYTVKDLTWNYVFGTEITKGEAKQYTNDFIKDYQRNGDDDNGIKTALLASDNFGSDWDKNEFGDETIPLVNDVNYIKSSGSQPSKMGGFYGCYGGKGDGKSGGLLSEHSDTPWGCCASNKNNACFFDTSWGWWDGSQFPRSFEFGVVLARGFE